MNPIILVLIAVALFFPSSATGSPMMIEIPAGEFTMGGGELSEHMMWVDSFSIDVKEVTNEDFAKIFSNHSYPPGGGPPSGHKRHFARSRGILPAIQ
ncbi:hypothetical protein UZ36_05695 [Candidatus Nitromaritima sp. SCGC AAA799-C22]|nr:hypothetical protein UZ36_05695 [Candidatus Nitromaritima sp. SCGC AAA799-C22]